MSKATPLKNKHDDGNDAEEDQLEPLDQSDTVSEEDRQAAAEAADPEIARQKRLIEGTEPKTELEQAQAAVLRRQKGQIERLTIEVRKLKAFISKRKQTYKRKRKDEGAPTRALSAYNIFVQDRFAKLSKDNEMALQSDDTNAQLKRVPPASLVASTGNQWKELSAEEKYKYEALAAADKKRYEEQMAAYQPPEKEACKKRNKTGYNMFFSAYVLQLKQSAAGVPPERGSVARLVGNAWKELTSEEKQYYEREAERRNELEPGSEGGVSTEPELKMPPPSLPPVSTSPSAPRQGMRHDMQDHRLALSPVHGPGHYHGGMPQHHQMTHHPQYVIPQPGYHHPHQAYYGQMPPHAQAAPYGLPHHGQPHHPGPHHHHGYD